MGQGARTGSDSGGADFAGEVAVAGRGKEGERVGGAAEPAVDGGGPRERGHVVCGRSCARLSWLGRALTQTLRVAAAALLASDDRLLDQCGGRAAVFRGAPPGGPWAAQSVGRGDQPALGKGSAQAAHSRSIGR